MSDELPAKRLTRGMATRADLSELLDGLGVKVGEDFQVARATPEASKFGCCCKCGKPIADLANCWVGVTGFVHARRGGGVNHIAERQQTGDLCCETCMTHLRAGISADQLRLGE